jgi:predicted NUDIX family NTP pyrophosphohydrolase
MPYRFSDDGTLEVLVVHPGGPLWAAKDDSAWSVAKGEYEPGEEPECAAEREFAEELGQAAPSGKLVRVWAVEGDLDAESVVSNEFEMEWPPRSGRQTSWPEVDQAAWMPVEQARRKLLKGQVAFVDRLVELLAARSLPALRPTGE